MNSYKVTFNFDTGKYDVVDREDDVILSSWDTHTEAVAEREHLVTPKAITLE